MYLRGLKKKKMEAEGQLEDIEDCCKAETNGTLTFEQKIEKEDIINQKSENKQNGRDVNGRGQEVVLELQTKGTHKVYNVKRQNAIDCKEYI